MEPIRKLDEMVDRVKTSGAKKRVAVAFAQDQNTIGAIDRAMREGFVEPVMIGDKEKIELVAKEEGISTSAFNIIHIPNDVEATKEAVRMVKNGEADVLMKGLVNTDKFLRAIIDKEKGLLAPKAVMSYACAIEIPKYHKLLFVSDMAVLPFPDLDQKIAMVNYTVAMAHKFGIQTPKVSLISATEKPGMGFPNTMNDAVIVQMNRRGQIRNCIIDGPLDLFLSCDKESVQIKGVPTPIDGDADVLIFPTLESCNPFYKALMLFAGGELAGLIQGTIKPVVLMSRSESAKSKYYCVALSCLMADNP
jgi:phosphate butyryltransferase